MSVRATQEDSVSLTAFTTSPASCLYILPQEGRTPLLCAVYSKNASIVKLLIEKGADINEADEVSGHQHGTSVMFDAAN